MDKKEKEFKINEYLKLKLKKGKTKIYVCNEEFITCKYLLFNIDRQEIEKYDNIESIDEFIALYNKENEMDKTLLDKETEFWGHCSNLQGWAENNYDTEILDMNLAFQLLKKLRDVGDPIANKVFKEEIAKRLQSNVPSVTRYLVDENYLKYLSREELEAIDLPYITFKSKKIVFINNYLDLRHLNIESPSELEPLCELSNLEYLNLSGNKLSSLPKCFINLINMKELWLNGNKFFTLPEAIRNYRGLKVLGLGSNYLSTLPISIENLKCLESLDLADNHFSNLPDHIGTLKQLKKLYLGINRLRFGGIPRTIKALKNLKKLNLAYNCLSKLPKVITELYNLSYLDLFENYLSTLPQTINNLKSLKTLILVGNRLKKLPAAIGGLPSLKILDLSGNLLSTIPKSMGDLLSLKILDLGYNNITVFPNVITNLISLKKLGLEDNNLTTLPESIANLHSLEVLALRGNDFKTLPQSLLRIPHLASLIIEAKYHYNSKKVIEKLLEKNVKIKTRIFKALSMPPI